MASRKPRAKETSPNVVVGPPDVEGFVTIHTVNPADMPAVARALLNEGDVRTVSAPLGFVVPAAHAAAAGFGTTPNK